MRADPLDSDAGSGETRGGSAIDLADGEGSRGNARPMKPKLRGWLHAGAFAAMLIGGPWLISSAPSVGSALAITVYVVSILALFGVSAAFHTIQWSAPARRWMRRADHTTIFIGIAGTYTAIAGLALDGWTRVVLLSVVWVGAGAGVALRQIWLDAPKWAVAIPYVLVGWAAVAVVPQWLSSLGGGGFALLVIGGGAYTAGAIVYAVRRPDPAPRVFGYHEVFHSCTLVGAITHFALIAVYVLPRAR